MRTQWYWWFLVQTIWVTLGLADHPHHWKDQTLEDHRHWKNNALKDLKKYLRLAPNTNIAKNVILFIGDGMGTSTITAARILKGQLDGKPREETELFMETLPYVGLSKVYSLNKQVPDSASTATAMLTGVKTNSRVLGLDVTATYNVCENNDDAKLTSMLHWAMEAGRSSGLVTTARVTHATPAAAYASAANRDWESDTNTPTGCDDIAEQLVVQHPDIQVILGGGRSKFLSTQDKDMATGREHSSHRQDGKNLIRDWIFDKQTRARSHQFVWNKGMFDSVKPHETDFLLGLFSQSHMAYELDRKKDILGEPSLAEMTKMAIQILQKNEQGFFLLVEGGRIDHGHHENSAKKALYDTLAFDDAVKEAAGMTDDNDTLIIVTADHSHVMTIAGYPDRGNGILDLAREEQDPLVDLNGLPYTTLAYTNGPSAKRYTENLTDTDTASDSFTQSSMTPLHSETHSGEDVAIFAGGPMAHLLTGVKENNVIAYVMAHAACVGNTGVSCSEGRNAEQECDSNASKSAGFKHIPQTFQTLLCILWFSINLVDLVYLTQ